MTKGMPSYGGMPYEFLMEKFEETHTDNTDYAYNDYMRSEITDWGSDKPFLESDESRRDSNLSNMKINSHYNGSRGKIDTPHHPDLFYGFMGNDPRGASLDPKFDMRPHIGARTNIIVPTMGHNDDYHIAESPWTYQSISKGTKEIHKRQKQNLKIFSRQCVGQLSNNNFSLRDASGDIRGTVIYNSDETLNGNVERFKSGDYLLAADRMTDGMRGFGAPLPNEQNPWKHSVGDTSLGVHKYGQNRGAGVVNQKMNVGEVIQRDQDFSESRKSRSANRQILGATMALAIKQRESLKQGKQEMKYGQSYEGFNNAVKLKPSGKNLREQKPTHTYGTAIENTTYTGVMPVGRTKLRDQRADMSYGEARESVLRGKPIDSKDVAAIYKQIQEDQYRRPPGTVQDNEHKNIARGLLPSANPEKLSRTTISHVTPNEHITNLETIISGLKEGTASARRKIASKIIADGVRNSNISNIGSESKGGLIGSADYSRIKHLTDMAIIQSAASLGLEVQLYGQGAPTNFDKRVLNGQNAYDPTTWHNSNEVTTLKQGTKPGEWKSHTQDQTTIGDIVANTFGIDGTNVSSGGGSSFGTKSLRADTNPDTSDMTDELKSFDN